MSKRSKGFGGFGNLGKIMQEVQRAAQEMESVQQELEALEIEGTSGGGAVTAVVNGAGNLVRLSIKPEVVDPEDVELLEDLVVSAVREALEKAHQIREDKLSRITGGFNLPGLF